MMRSKIPHDAKIRAVIPTRPPTPAMRRLFLNYGSSAFLAKYAGIAAIIEYSTLFAP